MILFAFMESVLGVVVFFISLAIIGVTVLQKEKGGGLSGAFGGSGSTATFGVKTADVLEKLTWFLFIIFVVCSFTMAAAFAPESKDGKTDKETDSKEASQPAEAEKKEETPNK